MLPLGKLPAEDLADLLHRYARVDERVVVGPGIGVDATVIAFCDRLLVAKTDPITFATDEIGWYAVNVNANDVACLGATPRWFLATLLLPEGCTDRALAERIFAQMAAACRELGVSLCGGHTEITYGLERPIVVGQMLGEAARDALVVPGGAQAGDVVILTKGIAVEATAIIARERGAELAGCFAEEFLARCRDFLHRPGISVVRDAHIATACTRVHAMHDPTEGGLATGLWELAQAARVGLIVDQEQIPVLPETAALCAEFGLDPLGVIASGALLVVVAAEDGERVVNGLQEAGVAARIIGRVIEPGEGVLLRLPGGQTQAFPRFPRDEITRLFE
ncbi:MAG: hydrogenase expression protein [Anaerolineae bacterium]|nr:hydrogenase expression protein [Anaerolineae bacterium]